MWAWQPITSNIIFPIILPLTLKTQEYVQQIDNWTEENKMKLNEKKTTNMVFNFTRDCQFTTEISLKNVKLETVDKTKLLGTIITKDLKWYENT